MPSAIQHIEPNSDCSEEDSHWNSELDISSDAWVARHVLHIEGEGYAGLSALYILAELMRRVGTMEKDSRIFQPQAFSSDSSPLFEPLRSTADDNRRSDFPSKTASPYRPCHYFDFVSGTSIGGSCAIMLGVMRFTTDEAIKQTELLLTGVITKIPRDVMLVTTGRRAKNSSMLERHLRLNLEERHEAIPDHLRVKANDPARDTQLFTMSADNSTCQTIVFTTHKESKGLQRPFVFRSYPIGPSSMLRNADNDTTGISLVDACRASLSVPSYFESVKIQGLGGSFRDASATIPNAAHETYHEVVDSSGSQIRFLLCFGTSSPSVSNSRAKSPERQHPGDFDNLLAAEAREHRFKYHRFADARSLAPLVGDSQAKIKATKDRVQEYCREASNSKTLDRWAKRLVKYRRLRAETTQWSEYAGLLSRSPIPGMHRSGYFDSAVSPDQSQPA